MGSVWIQHPFKGIAVVAFSTTDSFRKLGVRRDHRKPHDVDMSPLNMLKHVISTQPTRCAIVGLLACFKLCTPVSASFRALKFKIHDRFLMIITMHDSKLVTHTMLLSGRSSDVVGSYFKVTYRSTGRHSVDFVSLEHPCLRSKPDDQLS